ncbi:hypothetical protein L9Z17_02120 [Leptospira noguchii]|uniref:hypothetical protein n=1 Tax=Leptospira noguchii TaxID=28182 RepID=UPI001F0632D2|nr:hypothetical protein [Leptospira noguchii]MCH1910832.1 hypothetical protein [Leptospira noguchii]UOG62778.1 hypothetical protein MAL04_09990 [Leptospira noguchii]
MDYIKEWQEIINSQNVQKALVEHFSYLSENAKEFLEEWMLTVKEVTIWNECLSIQFTDGKHLAASPPATQLSRYKNWPESYQKLVKRHEFLDEYSTNFRLGGTDIFEPGEEDWDWENTREELLEEYGEDSEGWNRIKDGSKILSPITMYGNVWLYHPLQKNSQKESLLYFFSHALCAWPENPVDADAGLLSLQLLTGKRSGDDGRMK